MSYFTNVISDNFLFQTYFFLVILFSYPVILYFAYVRAKFKKYKTNEIPVIAFKKIKFRNKDENFLRLNKYERIELLKLALTGRVDTKINWNFTANQPSQPNYRTLFCLIHFISKDGIQNLICDEINRKIRM